MLHFYLGQRLSNIEQKSLCLWKSKKASIQNYLWLFLNDFVCRLWLRNWLFFPHLCVRKYSVSFYLQWVKPLFLKAKNSEPKNSNINLVNYFQKSSMEKLITVNLCNKIVTRTFLLWQFIHDKQVGYLGCYSTLCSEGSQSIPGQASCLSKITTCVLGSRNSKPRQQQPLQ